MAGRTQQIVVEALAPSVRRFDAYEAFVDRERRNASLRKNRAGQFFVHDQGDKLDWNPSDRIRTYGDLDHFEPFQDEWLRGGPVRRWIPKAYAGRPVFGIPFLFK